MQKKVKSRNPAAKSLEKPEHKQQIIPNKKRKYQKFQEDRPETWVEELPSDV